MNIMIPFQRQNITISPGFIVLSTLMLTGSQRALKRCIGFKMVKKMIYKKFLEAMPKDILQTVVIFDGKAKTLSKIIEAIRQEAKQEVFGDIDKLKLNYQGSHKLIDEEDYQKVKERHLKPITDKSNNKDLS